MQKEVGSIDGLNGLCSILAAFGPKSLGVHGQSTPISPAPGDEICVTAGGSSLRLLRGVSTELQLPGGFRLFVGCSNESSQRTRLGMFLMAGYTMLVHEILGLLAHVSMRQAHHPHTCDQLSKLR